MPSDEPLLTADELAVVLNVKPSTILYWARTKRIPAVRLSRKTVRFDREAVQAAIHRQAAGEAAQLANAS